MTLTQEQYDKLRFNPDGSERFTNEEILGALKRAQSSGAAPAVSTGTPVSRPPRAGGGAVPDLSGLLPPAYAIGGAALGAPFFPPFGSIVGAGIGGSVGEAQRQAQRKLFGLSDAPFDPYAMGAVGIEQLGAQATGSALGGGAMAAAKGMMRSAIKPTPTLQKNFPDVDIAEVALRERVPVGRGMPQWRGGKVVAGPAGSEKADVLRQRSSERTDALLEASRLRGEKLTTYDLARQAVEDAIGVLKAGGRAISPKQVSQIVQSVQRKANDLLAQKAPGADLRPIVRKKITEPLVVAGQPFFDQFGRPMLSSRVVSQQVDRSKFTAPEAKLITQIADDEVKAIYSALGRGEATAAPPSLSPAIASSSREATKAMAGTTESERRTQELIALHQALIGAESRTGGGGWFLPLLAAGAGSAPGGVDIGDAPRAALIYLLARHALAPEQVSRGALGLSHPLTQIMLQQGPRAAWYLAKPTPTDTTEGVRR